MQSSYGHEQGGGESSNFYGRQEMTMQQRLIFDGKRMRKPIQRKTVDYNSPILKYTEVSFFHIFFFELFHLLLIRQENFWGILRNMIKVYNLIPILSKTYDLWF